MPEELSFEVDPSIGSVGALIDAPSKPVAVLTLAHGAGAGMRHAFFETLSALLVDRGIATFRYNFPYMEQGKKAPSPRRVLLATVRSAIERTRIAFGTLPHFAGGKSMGGRMTSSLFAEEGREGVRGLVFYGFPLHPPGRPGTERGDHLADVGLPMLFLQGTRDAFAGLDLLTPIVEALGPGASLHVVDGADHSYKVLKRSGRSNEEVLGELADRTREWVDRLL